MKANSNIQFLKSFGFMLAMGFGSLFSQSSPITVSFMPMLGNSAMKAGSIYYPPNSSDSILIESLRFYISSIELLQSNQSVWKEKNSFHLVDIENPVSGKLNFEIPENVKYNQIKFNLGIDSITNVSGAMGGDLDPTKGMYWTWQSGYINLKLEGKSNVCKTIRNEFSFHVGGYQSPYYPLQTVQLDLNEAKSILIGIDIASFFKGINLANQNQLMSPGAEAVALSKLIAQLFKILPK